jgi:transglutaminase-like putative cysteine protease
MSAGAAPAPVRAAASGTTVDRAATDRAAADSGLLRLAAFAALAAFATAHWGTLVQGPPAGRLAGEVALAVAAGALLLVLGRSRLSGPVRAGLAAVTGLVTVAVGLVVAGLPARLLLPGNRSELADNLDRGLGGIRTVDWPYAGEEEWLRLAVLLGAPLLLGVAVTLAFWPARRAGGVLRGVALALLLLLYAVAVTENQPSAPMLRGVVLLLLVAAWLWLPRLSVGDALPATGVVLAVGLLSLPVAARLDANGPWWDYQNWNWFGSEVVSFKWEHSYGPLDWPRDGTTLLTVKSDRPHYWKVETLDSFDGFRWVRSNQNDLASSTTEIPDPMPERWDERINFSIRSLRTEFLVGAGTTYLVDGVDQSVTARDGTTRVLDEPLERGDDYEVFAYAPNPSARQMRAAGRDTALGLFEYTSFYLPNSGESALVGTGSSDSEPGLFDRQQVTMGLRDTARAGLPGAEAQVLDSPYERAYRLARRLAAGAPTTYDAVKRIENWLQDNLRYSERPPSQEVPLASFLFEDRRGYCQQFSGAMALMLRMNGIPARVSTGFSPGSFNKDTGEFRVRDLDAHSWVEVHFSDIGWVPFDPTPAAAPPELQSSGATATSAASGDAGEGLRAAPAEIASDAALDARGAGQGDDGRVPAGALPLALATLALLAGLALLGREARLRARLAPEEVVDAQVRELERALPRLGWRFPAGTTLLALERRLARAAGPGAAGYVARLRAYRFSPAQPNAPGRGDRRALRRDLTSSGGPLARLRGYLAVPPVGPRPRDS